MLECHQLESVVDSATGERLYEAMFANNPAWHRLGRVYKPGETGAMNSQEAIEGAHLNWLVSKERLSLRDIKLENGEAVDVEDNFAIVRTDTNRTLSVVGNDYVPLQNAEAFSFLDSLVQDGIMKYESAFALKGGKKICLLARMPSVDFVTKDDASLRYIFFMNGHGEGGIVGTPTSVRTVCANTVRIALGQGRTRNTSVTIRHSGNLESKLGVMRDYLSQFDKGFTRYREQAQSLLKGTTQEKVIEYLKELFPAPADDAGERSKTMYKNKMDEYIKFKLDQSNNMPSIKGTWWALFNSVTQFVDHGARGRESKDTIVRAENRFVAITSGPEASLKDKAFSLALEMAA